MLARSRSVAEALLDNETFTQLLRFAVAGVGVTLFSASIYLAVATGLHVPALLANTVSTACGIVVGYLVHSRWSFRADGHEGAMAAKFLMAAGAAFALNSFWVWLAVHALHLPAWTPVTGMVFATPLASFAVNRWWVFAPAAAGA
jgi:putative flippase GtrA